MFDKLVPRFFKPSRSEVIHTHTTQLASDFANAVYPTPQNVYIVCGDTSHVQLQRPRGEELSGKVRDQKHQVYGMKFSMFSATDGIGLCLPDIDYPIVSDQAFLLRSPLMKTLHAGDILFLDGGFKLPSDPIKRTELGIPEGLHIVQPSTLAKGTQYIEEQAEMKKVSDAIRTVIENVFGKMKEYKILAHRYPLKASKTLAKVITVVAALVMFNMEDRAHCLRTNK